MNKNKEWLKEQIGFQEIELGHFTSNYSSCEKMMLVDDIKDLIDQLDESEQKEKIQVPQWLTKLHTANLGKDLYAHLSVLDTYYSDEMSENQNLLAHMVLGDEWEVKEEEDEC